MVNEIVLTGRLTGDPSEMRTKTGVEVSKIFLAVDRDTREDKQKQTDFISCVAFGQTAKFINSYIKKGALVAVVGSLYQSKYVNKNGTEVKTYDVNIRNVTPLSKVKKPEKEFVQENEDYYAPAQEPVQTESVIDELSDDDLPF